MNYISLKLLRKKKVMLECLLKSVIFSINILVSSVCTVFKVYIVYSVFEVYVYRAFKVGSTRFYKLVTQDNFVHDTMSVSCFTIQAIS